MILSRDGGGGRYLLAGLKGEIVQLLYKLGHFKAG